PDLAAGAGIDDEDRARLRIEDDAALGHDRGGGTVIAHADGPARLSALGVEGVELMAAEAAADEDGAARDRGRRERAPARDGDAPASLAVLGGEGRGGEAGGGNRSDASGSRGMLRDSEQDEKPHDEPPRRPTHRGR